VQHKPHNNLVSVALEALLDDAFSRLAVENNVFFHRKERPLTVQKVTLLSSPLKAGSLCCRRSDQSEALL
jgi:hypothetical protein